MLVSVLAVAQGVTICGRPCLLQGSNQAFELGPGAGLVMEQQLGQDEVEGAAVAGVCGVLHEGEVLHSMVLQYVLRGVQLEQQFATHVA